ncbi:hypothetical protein Verru16b_02473 [Lacunisphaera limnophila]|uniref:Uncharacterized protein n=1 Tax=Lacunisphaera limnophila TaxID=1838286 RepID=A0A1D8AWY1_9BACT|nr:hypothetical protein [Lacunisphaera limnophila]AOS45392.1 hypothetical protein Verru16b_02473 [Lacunisphaera limnophila]
MPKPGRRRQPASSPPALYAGLLLLTAWLGAVLALPPARAHDPAPPADALVHQGKPGPWGELEYSRIMIEPPDEFMPPDYTASAARWEFTGFDPVRLEDLLRNAALDATQLQGLLDPAIRTTTPTSLILRPPDDLVLHLSPESRAILYNTLARLPGNPLHQEPFRFRADLIDDWFEGSGVRTEIVTRIRQLLYRRGNSLLFSDPHLVLPALATATERVQLVKTLARKSTLLLKVRIKPDSDLESLARYWGGGRRRKDVRPLLLSLARHPGA